MVTRNPMAAALVVLGFIVMLDVMLLVSGYRILIAEQYDENIVSPGSFKFGTYRDPIAYPKLECRYFTGRSVQSVIIPAEQIDECPFVYRPYR